MYISRACSYIYIVDDNWALSRWSTNAGEPFLFVKYDMNQLNILDVEKKILTMRQSIQLEKIGNCNLFHALPLDTHEK